MSLIVGSFIVAEIRVQGVSIRPVIGAYQLLFFLHATINPTQDARRRVIIAGAEVRLRSSNGPQKILGFARPDAPVSIQSRQFPITFTPALSLPIQAQQLGAIEEIRTDGDLIFELLAVGEAIDSQTEHPLQDSWHFTMPRSVWIEELRRAGFMDVLLLEIPMPVGSSLDERREAGDALRRAQAQFAQGDYRASVSSCRDVVQKLGHAKFDNPDWAGPLFELLASRRTAMDKDDREAAILAIVRHYTHQAHHTDGEGGANSYTRSEAKLVLALTAALVARAYER